MTEPAEPSTDLNSPDLLSPTDFQKFSSADANWFLGAIGSEIKNHCGWHIFPVKSDTVICPLGPQGTIPLPSLRVVSVESVTYEHRINGLDPETITVDPGQYTPHKEGFIEWHMTRPILRDSRGIHHMRPRIDYVTVTFTHGYDELPGPVALVGYEIAMRAMEKPAGTVKDLSAGPYTFGFNEFGAYFSPSQEQRLEQFRLQGPGA